MSDGDQIALFSSLASTNAPGAPEHRSVPGKRARNGTASADPVPVGAVPGRLAAVYEIVREWTWPRWLCDQHAAARIAAGETLRRQVGPDPAWVTCDDCSRDRQAAPGYVTPTARFEPTAPWSVVHG